MALTPQVRVSQAGTNAVTTADTEVQVSQAGVMAPAIWPATQVRVSQAGANAVTAADTKVRISQAGTMVVARGRVDDPYLRAWAYEMDTHWNYVLRLPTDITLVWDQDAQQWYNWGSGTSRSWRPTHGTNWLNCGSLMGTYGSNVVCGDDGNGALYMLHPLSPTDDDAILGAATPRTFQRMITGQITMRGNDMVPCYGVQLGGSIGSNEATYTDVTLYTSDDNGQTYDNRGTVSLVAAGYTARADWNSGLGSFTGPGRLFRIEDDGALARIDWLEMADPPEDEDG